MHRREVLGTIGSILAASSAGCSTNVDSVGVTAPTERERPVRLDRVVIENNSSKRSLFNVNVVRNGEYAYWGQHDVSTGTTTRITEGWEPAGETFAVVGMAKQFNNYEVVAMNDRQNVVEHPLEATFVIDERGDVQAKPSVIES